MKLVNSVKNLVFLEIIGRHFFKKGVELRISESQCRE
jgi:hypothetical protein